MIETEKIQLGQQVEGGVPVVEARAPVTGSAALESREPQVNPSNGITTAVAEPVSTPVAQQPINGGRSERSDDVTGGDAWLNALSNKEQGGEIPS